MVSNRPRMVMIPQNNAIVDKNQYSVLNQVFLAIIAKNLSLNEMIFVQVLLTITIDNNLAKEIHCIHGSNPLGIQIDTQDYPYRGWRCWKNLLKTKLSWSNFCI